MSENDITYQIRGAIFDVYNTLGPGLQKVFRGKKHFLQDSMNTFCKQFFTKKRFSFMTPRKRAPLFSAPGRKRSWGWFRWTGHLRSRGESEALAQP